MCDALLQELLAFILRLVESDDTLDAPLSEYLAVILGCEPRPLPRFPSIDRSHKCSELARYDPVDIAIVHSLIVLVFLHIESLEVVPVVFQAMLKSLEAVEDAAIVVAISFGGITEGQEPLMVGSESIIGFLRGRFENYEHEGTHQEGCICLLLRVVRAIMKDSVIFVLFIL